MMIIGNLFQNGKGLALQNNYTKGTVSDRIRVIDMQIISIL